MSRKSVPLVSSLAATAVLSAAACFSGGPATPPPGVTGDDGGMAPLPFQADPPSVYVAKVKNILVGLPPTAAEVQTVESDPTKLGDLIDQWMTSTSSCAPSSDSCAFLYTTKMMRFFELAFQQTQVTSTDFADQAYPRQLAINPGSTPLLVQNMEQSFARTMLTLTGQNAPLTQAMTTHQVMMTTALKETYAFLDVYEVYDTVKNGVDTAVVMDRFHQANPGLSITVEAKNGPIPITDTLNPSSPNYMHWYDPDIATFDSNIPNCNEDPVVYATGAYGNDLALTLHWLLLGGLEGHVGTDGTTKCPQFGGTPGAAQLTAADFDDWKMVTVRPPNKGEAVTNFYDLPKLRGASELVLQVPRVGFYSTPAFFANWQTNTSNQMRVTLNQALIVALGSSIDGTDTTAPSTTPGLDAAHASQPACFNCHQQLDTTRSIFTANFSWEYHNQLTPTLLAQPGLFAFRGVINDQIKSLDDFGNTLATHPYFASAWVQKLCYYANSAACDPTDPLFKQIVTDFSSGFQWNGLVKELLSSAIVTNATQTVTEQTNGEVVAVSRRDHLCAALNARLGFTDVCGLDALGGKYAQQGVVPQIVSGLPSDAYGRGNAAPILPNAPTLFYRSGLENICGGVAQSTIDVPMAKQLPNVKQWSSSNPDAAIADFVSLLLGLTPSDPRTAPATALLKSHFTAATQQKGTTPTVALQSTFVAACLSPSFDSIGM
jgi:hypothetical protein